jgi:hypothetical protein
MISLRRWILTGFVAAGVSCVSLLRADPPYGHGSLFDGSRGNHDPCANIPPGTQPAPPGTYVNKFFKLQAAKAEMDDFVIYRHMWLNNGTELGPLGRYQLDLITRRLATVPFPVVVETSKDEKVDSVRRDVILSLLTTRGFNDPQRVIVAYPIAEGLNGDEIYRIANGIVGLGDHHEGGWYGQGNGPSFGNFGLGGNAFFGPGFNGGNGIGSGYGFGGFGGVAPGGAP